MIFIHNLLVSPSLQPSPLVLQVRNHAATDRTLRMVRPAPPPEYENRPTAEGGLKVKLDHPPVGGGELHLHVTEGWPPACRPMIGLAYNTTTHCYPRGTFTARHTAVSVTPPPWFAFAHWGGSRGSIPSIRMDRLLPSSCRPRAGRSPSPAQAADRGVFQHRTVDDNVYGWYGGLPGGGR